MKSLYRIHHTASNGKQTAVTAASWVRHTYCCEPSLVLLPNFTKRLFGGAAGRLEGLGGIERSSSQETFIWFIPPLPFNCCWRFEIMTGASYGVPSIRTHYFASFPVMFFSSFLFQSMGAAGGPPLLRTPEQAQLQMFPARVHLTEVVGGGKEGVKPVF